PLASTFRYADVFPPQPVVGANMPSTVAFPVLATMNSSVASDDAKARVSWIPALEVMLQFESSSRWPSTLDAMQKVKTAFLIKLAEALATRKPPSAETPDAVAAAAHKKSKKAQRAEESSEDAEDKEDDPEAHLLFAGKGIPSLLSADHLDVCVDGIVFRLFVYHEKEAQLIRVWDRQRQRKRGLGSMTVEVATEDADNEQDGADAAEENASKLLPTLFPEGVTAVAYERFFTQRALHTSVIHSFATLHPFFMPTVRLAKRWLAAHLLSENFTDECVELLVVRVFIHSHPYDEPASPLVGLLRFLSLLATFDFFQQAVIVDVVADSAEHSRFTEEEVSNVETHFRNNRAALPALFISTQTDRQSSQWTLEGPSAGMLSRAATFARACLEMLTRCIRNPFSTDASFVSAFRTNLQDYDIIIHLKPVQVPRLYSSINAEEYLPLFVRPSKYKNIALSATLSAASFAARGESSLLVAFDPVGRFVAELQRLFSEYAIFSFDKYGGTIVAVALKPAAFSPRALSTNHALATMPAIRAKTLRPLPGVTSDPANQVVANIDALLEDFEEVGQGLVDRIEVQRKLW
ncbi:hypothetical protein CAOG_08976, partial [Capsaspora owczarzaki ATCC 30864]|uniref:hypothetical protein n=1 Tax=Capsaspora owczarzaki (strain ATCC 30864) TaxID=595528 RepID=UPI0003526091